MNSRFASLNPIAKPFEYFEKLGIWKAIINERPTAFWPHQPGLAQQSQVKRDVGLRQARGFDNLRDRTAVKSEAVQNAKPIGFGQQLEHRLKTLDRIRHA